MLPKIAFGHKKTAFSQAPKPQTAFLRSQPDSAHRFFSSLLDVRDHVTDVEVTGAAVWVYAGKPAYVLRVHASATHAAIRKSYIDIVEDGLTELGPIFTAEYRSSTDRPPEANIIDDRVD